MKKVLAVVLSMLMLISLTACGGSNPTEDFTEISWPTSELVKRIPVPESTFGNISSESADYFSVDIGNITRAQFDEYVTACQEAGFAVDYSKSNDSFNAYDAEGYYIWVAFDEEAGIMDIMTRAPEEESDASTDDTTTSATTTTTTKADSSNGIDADFKKSMDSYEAFMDKYVSFMKKYKANPTDMGLIGEYATYMSDYAKFVEDFENWEDEDLNAAELAHYVQVQSRVSQKLLEVAQ